MYHHAQRLLCYQWNLGNLRPCTLCKHSTSQSSFLAILLETALWIYIMHTCRNHVFSCKTQHAYFRTFTQSHTTFTTVQFRMSSTLPKKCHFHQYGKNLTGLHSPTPRPPLSSYMNVSILAFLSNQDPKTCEFYIWDFPVWCVLKDQPSDSIGQFLILFVVSNIPLSRCFSFCSLAWPSSDGHLYHSPSPPRILPFTYLLLALMFKFSLCILFASFICLSF